ncbi:6-bladed beta-propeller [Parabacteroides bouchesdurhonensis]|uniref:6-bladed beta-propeller n=1 Tax=Parabacteroides bouchesdurhonensis TaxID=1936995 RepID=UPI000C834A93|nr:6-bladed beta-propeller [Parabacteroides bouchesdurhonensis]
MKNFVFLLSICLLTACNHDSRNNTGNRLKIIDVEEALRHPKPFTLADLGKEQTYIPLETTDSSIVAISSVTAIAVTDRHILIGARNVPIKVFDKATGHYLRQIGQIGNGPAEYTNGTSFSTDPITHKVYVRISASKYQSYDITGHFLETVDWEEAAKGMIVAPYFLGDKIYTYVNIPTEQTCILSYLYDVNNKAIQDSLPLRWGNDIPTGKPKFVMPLSGAEMLGGMSYIVQFEDNRWTYGLQNNASYWYYDGEVRMKDFFCDTLFTVETFNRLIPRVVFKMGNFGGFGRYENKDAMEDKYIITRLMETENIIYFNMFKNMYDVDSWLKGNYNPPYCGIYDKRSGETKVMKSVSIENDKKDMPGFSIYNISTTGELIVCYQTEDLVEARNKMPKPEQPEWLKQLKEDDNPVILLIR